MNASMRDIDVEKAAYLLWQQRGCPEGSPEIDWIQAESKLGCEETGPVLETVTPFSAGWKIIQNQSCWTGSAENRLEEPRDSGETASKTMVARA